MAGCQDSDLCARKFWTASAMGGAAKAIVERQETLWLTHRGGFGT
jgi:hypothetical protein